MPNDNFTEELISIIRMRLDFGQSLTELTEGLLKEYEKYEITPTDIWLAYKAAIILDKDLEEENF